jgi:hypothetical protein
MESQASRVSCGELIHNYRCAPISTDSVSAVPVICSLLQPKKKYLKIIAING